MVATWVGEKSDLRVWHLSIKVNGVRICPTLKRRPFKCAEVSWSPGALAKAIGYRVGVSPATCYLPTKAAYVAFSLRQQTNQAGHVDGNRQDIIVTKRGANRAGLVISPATRLCPIAALDWWLCQTRRISKMP